MIHIFQTSFYKWAGLAATRIALVALIIAFIPTAVHAQKCKKLEPAGVGQDDSARINECLSSKGKAKLKEGTFLLYGPIIFPRNTSAADVSNAKLIGKGTDKTRLIVQSDCNLPWPFVDEELPGRYQPAIQAVRSPKAEIRAFELDLGNLRKDCGYMGNYMVFVNRSPESRITQLRITGSRYAAPGYTTGGSNGGGILLVNSEGSLISENTIRDVGFANENGGTSNGHAGISVQNSANSAIQNNNILRVAFGIVISNSSSAGDSSGTTITGNNIVGAAAIDCPDCSQGRAIKLQACGLGGELPLKNLVISNNNANEFGGANGIQGGSGLDLVCGVRYSRFENNVFMGAGTAEFGLQIRSSFLSPSNATHHNKFDFNIFSSGRGRTGCNGECSDVNFTSDGPDQIGIRRNGLNREGTNSVSSFRSATDRGCNEHSHAFFNYLTGKNFVRHGQSILLAASGVRPSAAVTFRFRRASTGLEVAAYATRTANRNCIVNQEEFPVDEATFPKGDYDIFADYSDGNSDAFISEDPIGTIKVKRNKQN